MAILKTPLPCWVSVYLLRFADYKNNAYKIDLTKSYKVLTPLVGRSEPYNQLGLWTSVGPYQPLLCVS